MDAINFYSLKPEEKRTVFEQIGTILNIHPSAVEKDWWVVQTLALIQEMDVAPHIVFKGGTSLSKAWSIIERFSEDIDLALDKRFLGIDECKTVKQVKRLRSIARNYINNAFIPELQSKFAAVGLFDILININEEDGKNLEPAQILLAYTSYTVSSDYTKPEVKIEIGSRSLREPFTNRAFSSLVGVHFPNKPFADKPIIVPCVNPERTFLEKLFLLHEEFQKPENMIRVNRLSRHLYDIEMLMRTEFADIALINNDLYNKIITHRSIYTKISGIDYRLHQPKTLNPIPPDSVMANWKKDYKKMQDEMIYGESLSFDKLIERLKEIKNRINHIEW